MKRFVLFALCAGALALIPAGCTMGIDADGMYNFKRLSSEIDASVVLDVSITDEPLNAADDPFKTGEWNNIGYKFNGNKFGSWFFHSSFDDNTVPTYAFKDDSNQHGPWTLGSAAANEWTSTSPNGENKAQGYSIDSMTVYCYRGKNPLVSPNSSYNAEGGRMTRFYFYRIRGSVSIASLDQHLVAVDTYSKFIFAYGKVTATKSLVGKLMPTAFEALDLYAADRGATKGEKRPFYQYDPIGFVKETGEVILYKQYRDEMGNASTGRTNYFPQIHDKNANVATQDSESSHGKSPYLGNGAAPVNADAFLDAMGGKKYEMRQQEKYTYTSGSRDVETEGNGMALWTWQFSPNGKILTSAETDFATRTRKTAEYIYNSQLDDEHAKYKASDDTFVQFSYEDKGEAKRAVLYKEKDTSREQIGELNFRDPGPDFLIRVKGATFEGDSGNTKYAFSDKGVLTMNYLNWLRQRQERTYTWEKYGNNATEAMYGGYKVRLPGDGYNTIEMATTLGSAALIYEWRAVRKYKIDEKDERIKKFLEAVAGKSYKSRQKEEHTYKAGGEERTKNVYNFKTDTYTFGADGRTVQHTFTDSTGYTDKITQTTYTFTEIVDATNAKYTLEDKQATVTFKYQDGKLLKNGAEVGDVNFKDEGPHFLLRVAGATFEGTDSELYKFSPDGATLTLTYKPTISNTKTVTYTWSEPSPEDKHISTIAQYSGWNTKLSDNDKTIEMATTYGSAALVYGWKATRK